MRSEPVDWRGLARIRPRLLDEIEAAREIVVGCLDEGASPDLAHGVARLVGGIEQALEVRGYHHASLLADELIAVCGALGPGEPAEQLDVLALVDAGLRCLQDAVSALDEPDVGALTPVALVDELRSVRGAPLLSSCTVFWPPRPPDAAGAPNPGVADAATRLRPYFQRTLLAWLRGGEPDASIAMLRAVLAEVATLTAGSPEACLWQAGEALCARLASGDRAPGLAHRRLLGQLERELGRLAAAGPLAAASELRMPLLASLQVHDSPPCPADPRRDEALARVREDLLRCAVALEAAVDADDDAWRRDAAHALGAVADGLALAGEGTRRRLALRHVAELAADGDGAAPLVVARQVHALAAGLEPDDDAHPSPPVVEPVEDGAEQIAPGAAPRDPVVAIERQLAALSARDSALWSDVPYDDDAAEAVADEVRHAAESLVALRDDDAALATDGIPVDGELLENLSVVANEIGSTRSRMERRVAHLRDGLHEMGDAIRELREHLRHVEAVAEPGEDEETLAAGELPTATVNDIKRRLQRLSTGLDELAEMQGSFTTIADETESLLVRQARDSVAIQQGLMRSRMVPIASRVLHWQGALGRVPGVPRLRLLGGDVLVDQGLLASFSPLLVALLESLAPTPDSANTVRITVSGRRSELAVELDAPGFELPRASLDAVEAAVAELGGAVARPGAADGATAINLRLPRQPPVVQVLRLRCAAETVAVPLEAVEGVVRLPARDAAARLEDQPPLLYHEGTGYLFVYLGALLGFSEDPPSPGAHAPVVLLHSAGRRMAVLVDEVGEREDVVVKPLGPLLDGLSLLDGASVIGDEAPVLVLDVAELMAAGMSRHP